MSNLKITEIAPDGTETILTLNDIIKQLLDKAELVYGKFEYSTYNIAVINGESWILKYTQVEYDGDDVESIIRVCDFI